MTFKRLDNIWKKLVSHKYLDQDGAIKSEAGRQKISIHYVSIKMWDLRVDQEDRLVKWNETTQTFSLTERDLEIAGYLR